jgi:EAL domain-containing protein (putative c-di-GMP-specific phosphodiesterase class I)/FixJ family two-component response regulator
MGQLLSTTPITRICAIDDDPFMLKLLRGMLDRLGYGVVACFERGQDALDELAINSSPPDIILLDINMPRMDGIEVVRHLAARDYPGCLILISGEDEAMLRATSMLASLRGIAIMGSLPKPPPPARLADLLKRCEQENRRRSRRGQVFRQRAYSADELRVAIETEQLLNHYQPKVRVDTGEVVGVEALARWQHPEDGLLPPRDFIALAEAHGLIDELTRCVLRNALAQAAVWRQSGIEIPVSINISMDSLANVSTAEFLLAETLLAGANPQSIVLELTESRLMRDLATVLDVVARLHLKRFRLSVDDFGTGHASLVVLRDLLFDELKIDGGFVQGAWHDERLASFFRASLDLSRHLHMDAVAEGVESAEDWHFVRASGCTIAQGFYIASPMPGDDLPGWIPVWHERLRRESLLSA